MIAVFDVESDGLLDVATKIHCLSYDIGNGPKTILSYDRMRKFLSEATVLIGHNIVCYDIPLLEKLLNIKIKARLIDTLALSWYLNVDNILHGLEFFGRKYGVKKPKIEDWSNLSTEDYTHRCEEDVKINRLLWTDLEKHLLQLYEDEKEVDRLIKYLTFKMECLRMAQDNPIKLDLEAAEAHRNTLLAEQAKAVSQLIKVMPSRDLYKVRTKPAVMYKKNGDVSALGQKWFDLLKDQGLPKDHKEPIELHAGYEPPNPNSHHQVKDWLFSLGWEPCTYKYEKNADGTERKIPQVRVDGELTQSVIDLTEYHPFLKHLEGLTIVQHRLSIFKGFLETHKDGYLTAEAHGFTNTLRLKHKKPLVNLPGVEKPWGKEIRGCLLAPEGYIACGSDMVSLEDTTKRHYMYPYDPEYVREMSEKGFDPHLDLAKHAGAVSQAEIDEYNREKELKLAIHPLVDKLTPIRKVYKVANYSCVYGVGPPKLAISTGLSVPEAKLLREAYWKRNWSVQKLSSDLTVKTVKGKRWLFNPVSRLWYNLRYDKDRFSTLNQSTGVYCFDRWVALWSKSYPYLSAQFHDEIVAFVLKGKEGWFKNLLKSSISTLNDQLKLNIDLGVDVQFGGNYADVH